MDKSQLGGYLLYISMAAKAFTMQTDKTNASVFNYSAVLLLFPDVVLT